MKRQPTAIQPFLTLLSLTAVMVVGLGIAVVWHSPAEHHALLALCRLEWDEVLAHAPAWRVLVPASALAAIVVGGLQSIFAQLLAAYRFKRALRLLTIPTPAGVAHVAQCHALTVPVQTLAWDEPLAFCLGLRRPRVYLSTGLVDLLDDDELAAVLLHEQHHGQRRDPLVVLLSRAVGAALRFVPVAAHLVDRISLTQEVAADRYVLHVQGNSVPLASALLKLARQSRHQAWATVPLSPLNPTRERVLRLVDGAVPPDRLGWRRSLASVAIVVALFGISYSSVLPAPQQAVLHTECPAAVSMPDLPHDAGH